MKREHVCYMDNGSIISTITNNIIERPAILVSKEADTLHGWGNFEHVQARFERYAAAYSAAGDRESLEDLMLIELSEFKIEREMACYVLLRAAEFTATGFIRNLCRELIHGSDPLSWLKSEMERISIDLTEKEWR